MFVTIVALKGLIINDNYHMCGINTINNNGY